MEPSVERLLSENVSLLALTGSVLGLPHPGFLHVPVVNNASGEKLSKQTGAIAFDTGTHAGETEDRVRAHRSAPGGALKRTR